MEEKIEIAELAGLKEIALPEPFSYMPQTVAWYILFGLVLMAAISLRPASSAISTFSSTCFSPKFKSVAQKYALIIHNYDLCPSR